MLLYRGSSDSPGSAVDIIELTELRARQRTFDGAYRRTALANLGYALTVLRLFDVRFYNIGILFLVLSTFLFASSFSRGQHARRDFTDAASTEKLAALYECAIPTVGQEDAREFGRPFVTAGNQVAVIALGVFAIELAILVLILRI